MENKQININERSRTYDIKFEYHSDLMCQNYDCELEATVHTGGKITFRPGPIHRDWVKTSFTFDHSDPDRVLAITKAMEAFAKMVKHDNKKAIDISNKA